MFVGCGSLSSGCGSLSSGFKIQLNRETAFHSNKAITDNISASNIHGRHCKRSKELYCNEIKFYDVLKFDQGCVSENCSLLIAWESKDIKVWRRNNDKMKEDDKRWEKMKEDEKNMKEEKKMKEDERG